MAGGICAHLSIEIIRAVRGVAKIGLYRTYFAFTSDSQYALTGRGAVAATEVIEYVPDVPSETQAGACFTSASGLQ